MAKVGDKVNIDVTIQGGTIIGQWTGKIASVNGDKIEVDIPAITGGVAKLPATKAQLRPGKTAEQWSITGQVKTS